MVLNSPYKRQYWICVSSHPPEEFRRPHRPVLTLSALCTFSLCWAGRANSWAATVLAFILTVPPPPSATPGVLSAQHSAAFSMLWGLLAGGTSKPSTLELRWGDKQPKPNWAAATRAPRAAAAAAEQVAPGFHLWGGWMTLCTQT